jgi:hypothetical protein
MMREKLLKMPKSNHSSPLPITDDTIARRRARGAVVGSGRISCVAIGAS